MHRLLLLLCLLTTFRVGAQELYHISSIDIEGNHKTKREIILRELSFQIGDSLSMQDFQKKLLQSNLNIESQWLFNFIDIQHAIQKSNILVSIKVVERWYVWPYPILEISERNFNVFWDSLKASNFTDFSRLNYGLFLNWYNFRGRNELLKIKFRKGYKEHYLFEYDIPYLNKEKTIGTTLNFELFRMKQFHYYTINNKLIYADLDKEQLKDWNTSLSIRYKKDLNSSHKLSIQHRYLVIPDHVNNLNPNYLPFSQSNFQYSKLEYHFKHEKRNSTSYPVKGSFSECIVSGYKGFDNDFNNFSVIAKTEHHLTIKPRLYFGSSLKAKWQTNNKLPYVLYQSLGFEDYLRGYEYYVIDGQHYVLSKTALKYELIPKTHVQLPYFKLEQFKKTFYSVYFSIFADMGQVIDHQFSEMNPLNNIFLRSQGMSLDIVTYYDKLVRLEYSRNHLNEWGLFIHFSNPF